MNQSADGDAIAASGRVDATAAPVTLLFGAVRGAAKGTAGRSEPRADKRAHRGERGTWPMAVAGKENATVAIGPC